MKLRITRVGQQAKEVKSFELRSKDAELPTFTAGAHLPVRLRLPDGREAKRQYSLLSDPADRSRYEIAVRLEQDGQGGSRFLHEALDQGDVIDASEPVNDFPLAPDAMHSVLIAGGIGITPILSMLRQLSAQGTSLEVHYAARSPLGMPYRDEVERLAGDRASFYFSQTLRPTRLDLHRLLAGPKPGTHVYVCGPGRMIEAVRDIAAERGWPAEQVHFESFGARKQASDQPIEVELTQSGLTLTVPANQTILDTMLDAGVFAPYECKRGECGYCMTEVLDGEPDHRDHCLDSQDRSQFMCTCVSRAKTPKLVLNI